MIEVLLRTFKGTVLSFDIDEARVLLSDEDDKTHEYILPAEPLREACITEQFHPFELEEWEVDGLIEYRYRAMASKEEAVWVKIDLDKEHEQMLQAILKMQR